ncbi:hypothetical protein BDGGKGIB_04127 [Nodularia sphaerocarpa UHCC 0038]|nr:hypothetical protein BDGGKGIB_04127 [Nodularia sphaerocarpa UHCC 0038]
MLANSRLELMTFSKYSNHVFIKETNLHPLANPIELIHKKISYLL